MSAPLAARVQTPNPPERAFHLLLRAYPESFRAAYGPEMTLLLRDMYRDSEDSRIRFWTTVAMDVMRSAPAERIGAFRSRWPRGTQTEDRTMRPMATLAIMIGMLEFVGALTEVWAGWAQIHDGYWLAAVAVVVVAALLLASAGIVLLRGARGSVTAARVATVASLLGFAGASLIHPWMSIVARILGICVPVALLLFIGRPRRSAPSAPLVG